MSPAAAVRLPGAGDAPDWLRPLIRTSTSRPLPPPLTALSAASAAKASAVLILFSDGGDAGPDVLLTERASTLRAHGGQPAFPGGGAEPGEDAVTTALREAQEETGIDPASVTPVLQIGELYLGFSGYRVIPVVGYWRTPGPIRVMDPAETAVVTRIPISRLVDPARRGRVSLSSGRSGAAFEVEDLVIWGFTAMLLDVVLEFGGWTRPWQPGRELQLPPYDAGLVGDVGR